MEMRHATSRDVSSLAQLMTELGYPTSSEEMVVRLEAIVGRTDHAVFVAVENDIAAGMVAISTAPSLYRNDPQGAIVALVVSSRFRGRGLGGLLVRRGEIWLRDRGVNHVTVKPSTHREDAHRLYARLGYEHTGLRFSKTLV